MPIDAAAFLESPRGRHLCFEVALAASAGNSDDNEREPFEESLAVQFGDAASHLDDARGRGAVRYSSGSDGPGALPPRPRPAIADLASALEIVDLDHIDSAAIADALEVTVDVAVYWDEPDGLEQILANPVMRPALERIATRVLHEPETTWWSTPVALEQWKVVFTDSTHPAVPEKSAVVILHDWRTDAASDAVWWSIPSRRLTSTTRADAEYGPVGLSLIEDTFGWKKADATRLFPRTASRIYEIVDASAWAELCRAYPLDAHGRAANWSEITGRVGRWVMPDFSLVARDYDAVHLTVSAYLSSAGTPIAVDTDTASVIAGWHPDETFWLIDVETDPSTRTGWSYDDDAYRWRVDAPLKKAL